MIEFHVPKKKKKGRRGGGIKQAQPTKFIPQLQLIKLARPPASSSFHQAKPDLFIFGDAHIFLTHTFSPF